MKVAGLAGLLCVVMSVGMSAGSVLAQPKQGGALVMSVQGDVDSYDCHASISTPAAAMVLPSYSLLLRYDTENGSKIVGDLAKDWTVSDDGLTYSFNLREGVKFHDGTTMTAKDVKVSFDRIRTPPAGVTSLRQSEFVDVASIETPDDKSVVFKLKNPNSGFIYSLTSPWNCIYSAALLESDPDYPKTKVMGTGPFEFVRHDRGARWVSKRFDDYFLEGQPYLDSLETVVMQSANALVNAIAGGQVDGSLGLLAPPEIARMQSARGDKIQFISSEAITLVFATFNTRREAFKDERVRRALNLAIDRYTGVEVMRQLTNLYSIGGLIRPGYKMGRTPEEMEGVAGYGKDIAANRAEAKRLLAEAGYSDLKIKFLNRNTAIPYQPIGVFLADQWRQIGIETEITTAEMAPYLAALQGGDFDVALDFNTQSADTPAVLLTKYLPGAAGNYGGYEDQELVDLFNKAKRALDEDTLAQSARAFEDRVLEKSYIAPLFWATRTAVLPSDVKGWISDPSYFVGWDMARAWRDQ